jgi:hypothetical protein
MLLLSKCCLHFSQQPLGIPLQDFIWVVKLSFLVNVRLHCSHDKFRVFGWFLRVSGCVLRDVGWFLRVSGCVLRDIGWFLRDDSVVWRVSDL